MIDKNNRELKCPNDDPKSFGFRLWQLMKENNHSARNLYELLNENKKMLSESEFNKTTDSQTMKYKDYEDKYYKNANNVIKGLFKETGLNSKKLRQLANIYSVSSDYLLGFIDSETHKKTDICRETGLSKKAVEYCLNNANINSVVNLSHASGITEEGIVKYTLLDCKYSSTSAINQLFETEKEFEKFNNCLQGYFIKNIQYNFAREECKYICNLDSDDILKRITGKGIMQEGRNKKAFLFESKEKLIQSFRELIEKAFT